MKPHWTALPLLLAASMVLACGNHHDETGHHDDGHQSDSALHSTAPNYDDDGHDDHARTVQVPDALAHMALNDGHKWLMDDHTRASFAAMADSFLGADHGALTEEGRKEAGAALDAQLKDLIQGCTMEGPPHDQLHIFLSGYLPAVAALSNSGKVEDAQRVEHYLRSYGQYFE